MTELVQKAFNEIAKLTEDQQEAFAEWILAELEDEAHWDRQFAESRDKLEQLGEQALAQYRAGLAEELNPDELE